MPCRAGRSTRGERRLPEATRQAQLRKYGLDKPLWEQYFRYMWHAAAFRFRRPLSEPDRNGDRPDQAGMAGDDPGSASRRSSSPIRSGSSSASSRRSGRTAGSITSSPSAATLGLTVPNFVVAIWLILIFSVRFQLLPTGRLGQPEAVHHAGDRLLARRRWRSSRATRGSASWSDARRLRPHGAGEGAQRAPRARARTSRATPSSRS